jgi:hypothetical protein
MNLPFQKTAPFNVKARMIDGAGGSVQQKSDV